MPINYNNYNSVIMHPNYNPSNLRIILPMDKVMSLPVKEVDENELYHLMEKWEYNPAHYYEGGLGPDVTGHDLKFRYREI